MNKNLTNHRDTKKDKNKKIKEKGRRWREGEKKHGYIGWAG